MSTDSTLCFRRFRRKNTELSRLYWSYVLSSQAVIKLCQTASKDDYVVDIIQPGFSRGMLPITASQYESMSIEFLSRSRLHILLVCSANLEAYLQEITFAYLASKGHKVSHLKLDAIGEALGSPILSRASLPQPLSYAEKLFEVDLGQPKRDWDHFYKLRCILAHNGGTVTPRTLRDIPSLELPLNAIIGLTWEELFSALDAGGKIVDKIDSKVRSLPLKRAEIARELALLKAANKLPHISEVWKFLHEEFGLSQTKKPFRDFVYAEFYRN